MFAIVKGSLEDVLRFQTRFGALHPNMKMEWNHSCFSLPFLDVNVSLEAAPGQLYQASQLGIVTRVYQKVLNAIDLLMSLSSL